MVTVSMVYVRRTGGAGLYHSCYDACRLKNKLNKNLKNLKNNKKNIAYKIQLGIK